MKKIDYPKLPKAFKRKWIAALRSGKFKQGENYLKNNPSGNENEYCCLGVACEILGLKNIDKKQFISRGIELKGISKVPKVIVGDMDDNKVVKQLAFMNDGKSDEGLGKKSFEQIANWIEKNL